MANYYAVSRTNYFRVTDEEKYNDLIDGLSSEDEFHDFTYKDENGVTWHGFGTYGNFSYNLDEDGNMGDFYEELQKILPEDEAFMLFESGYEKLRYVTGYVDLVTHNNICGMSIEEWAIQKAKELVGPTFTTKTEY